MRRLQAKSHFPILSKVMDVEEPEVKIAVVGLLWTLLRNGRQRRQVERLRQGRNIAHDPIVRLGATTSEVFGEALASL